ncbi:MAG: hypothetical protein ACRDYA_16060 [Egibacteraceae bacterium]
MRDGAGSTTGLFGSMACSKAVRASSFCPACSRSRPALNAAFSVVVQLW